MGPGASSDPNGGGYVPGTLMNQPMYPDQQSFAPPPGSAAPYSLQCGTVPRSDVVQPDRRDSRFAILILLVSLLLLGLSVYLAVRPGFIHFPFFNSIH